MVAELNYPKPVFLKYIIHLNILMFCSKETFKLLQMFQIVVPRSDLLCDWPLLQLKSYSGQVTVVGGSLTVKEEINPILSPYF